MKRWKVYAVFLPIELALLIFLAVACELKSSDLQAHFFSKISSQIDYTVGPGPSDSVSYPTYGPLDIRRGYTRIPTAKEKLLEAGYQIQSQARMSPRMLQLVNLGLFPIYHEGTVAGLRIFDKNDEEIYVSRRPIRYFTDYHHIPPVIVKTLLFIENREILDPIHPKKNPAVEWDRLGKAVLEKAVQELYPDRSAPGGSTLATQLEKYRHAYQGRTVNAKNKFQQMLSASFRAYLDGPETLDRRQKIILDYINSIPLAALPGYGEVNGLGDGLWAWYGSDFDETMKVLSEDFHPVTEEDRNRQALAYKQVLSLFISHRRPSHFLLIDVSILDALTDEYLGLLEDHHIIPGALREAAESLDLHLQSEANPPPPVSFTQRKAANAIRTQLLSNFGFSKLYDLDQIDLSAKTTVDRRAQDAVADALVGLKTKEKAAEMGLTGEKTLDKGDPAKVIYSVTLYEHRAGMNLLRVETDNYDKPFNINEGTKLDLGSTAKLRVTTNYLYIVGELFDRYAAMSKTDLAEAQKTVTDPISVWAITYLRAEKSPNIVAMLDAAMDRKYSADTGEGFFTGGGLHHFKNFKKEDNGRIVTVQEAIRNSINLPFIRLMRDIVRYYMAQIPGSPTRIHDKLNDEARQVYLGKFADKEGTYFLEQFYQKYRKLPPDEILATVVRSIRPTPVRLAAVFRYMKPNATVEEFSQFLQATLQEIRITPSAMAGLYEKYGPGKFNLQDQGYIAKLHPLELWLAHYLSDHPSATFKEAADASKSERQEVYAWLFKSRDRRAQDNRIRTLIETEAFLEIHRMWKRVGYPFESLVPSYATAIGSSGDRPAALAELLGIILNDGIRYPSVRIQELELGKSTPFETTFRRLPSAGERVLKPEIAARLRRATAEVVEQGTARRVFGVYKDLQGKPLVIGGKTGTGDHRYLTFAKGGGLLSSRVVNRTATFAFYLGDRFFGVVSAHVHGPEAANYDFTSALAAGLLKALAPSLTPLIHESLRASHPHQAASHQENKCVSYDKKHPLTEYFVRTVIDRRSRSLQCE